MTPFGSGKRFGEEERKEVIEALESDILFYVFGTKAKEMENRMKSLYGMKYCHGCSSETAAVHIALGSLELEPGREVITSAVTDMGSLTSVLYQMLVPRFEAQTAFPMIRSKEESYYFRIFAEHFGTHLAVKTVRQWISL